MLGVRYRGVGAGDLDAGGEAVSDLRCDGVFKAKPCGKLILKARTGRVTLTADGPMERPCDKCGKLLRFFHEPARVAEYATAVLA